MLNGQERTDNRPAWCSTCKRTLSLCYLPAVSGNRNVAKPRMTLPPVNHLVALAYRDDLTLSFLASAHRSRAAYAGPGAPVRHGGGRDRSRADDRRVALNPARDWHGAAFHGAGCGDGGRSNDCARRRCEWYGCAGSPGSTDNCCVRSRNDDRHGAGGCDIPSSPRQSIPAGLAVLSSRSWLFSRSAAAPRSR